MAARLGDLATELPNQLKISPPDRERETAAARVFGKRPFFDERIFGQVLRLRGLIDFYAATSPDIAQFLTVAALSSLVPASLLIRRGDLRFRSGSELSVHRPDLVGGLVSALHRIASDLLDLVGASGSVECACPDARSVASINSRVDAVITSPPYLNGTNYFRNTKIELWFLRFLSSREDLRRFRDLAECSILLLASGQYHLRQDFKGIRPMALT